MCEEKKRQHFDFQPKKVRRWTKHPAIAPPPPNSSGSWSHGTVHCVHAEATGDNPQRARTPPPTAPAPAIPLNPLSQREAERARRPLCPSYGHFGVMSASVMYRLTGECGIWLRGGVKGVASHIGGREAEARGNTLKILRPLLPERVPHGKVRHLVLRR